MDALKRVDAGIAVCCELGISSTTFYTQRDSLWS